MHGTCECEQVEMRTPADENSLQNKDFYIVTEKSGKIIELCDMIFQEIYDKRTKLLGVMTSNDINENDVSKKLGYSWISSLQSKQDYTIKRLVEIKEVIESI